MESTLLSVGASTTMSITPIIVHLHRSLSTARPCQITHLNHVRCVHSSRFGLVSMDRGFSSLEFPRNRLQFVVRSAAPYSAGGGGFGGIDGGSGGGGGGGGGDDVSEGGYPDPSAVAPVSQDVSSLSSDVIVLDVGGMTCGGCAASVKRILESQPQVSSASVNLTTETAIVWPVSEARVTPNWRKEIGEALVKHLTSCGFKSNLRDKEAIDGDIQL